MATPRDWDEWRYEWTDAWNLLRGHCHSLQPTTKNSPTDRSRMASHWKWPAVWRWECARKAGRFFFFKLFLIIVSVIKRFVLFSLKYSKLLPNFRFIQGEANIVLQSDSTQTIKHIQKCLRQKFQCSRRPSYSTTLFFYQ